MRKCLAPKFVLTLSSLVAAPGCGHSIQPPEIAIINPVETATTSSGIRLGGTIARAAFVHVHHEQTDRTVEGYVFYRDGLGTWFVDVQGLVPGANDLTATADADGRGEHVARTGITIHRPEVPALLMVNGPDRLTTTTYWRDVSSIGGGHALALFADGTGRATTGSTETAPAGPVVDITWTLLAPDAIALEPPGCSFEQILRISGSLAEGLAFGQIVTVGGAGVSATNPLELMPGAL